MIAGTDYCLKDYLIANAIEKVKLHLGCGGKTWMDFVNVDLYPADPLKTDSSRSGCVADVFADMRDLGLDNSVVDEIFTSHTFEHFTRWEAEDMLTDWYRMLKAGGKCIIETPDLWRCILWLVHPNKKKRKLGRNQLYGNQWDRIDFETHRYVWTPGEIRTLATDIGFSSIAITHKTLTHHSFRDMQVTLEK